MSLRFRHWRVKGLLSTLAALAVLMAAGAHAEDPKGLAVGQPMAEFGLRKLDFATGQLGPLVWLSDFVGPKARSPKRVLLLNFYATWCKPCTAEVPKLVAWQREFGPRGLQVLSVNYRAPNESWESAVSGSQKLLAKEALPYPLLFDKYTNRNQLLYMGARGTLPCNVLIGADGKIIARYQGGQASKLAEIEQTITALLEAGG